MVVCFSGHRPVILAKYDVFTLEKALRSTIRSLFFDEKADTFITGMALGTDTLAALSVLELKDEGHKISLECAVPCRTQALRWSKSDRDVYSSVLARADKVTVLYETYNAWCMLERNRYMVDSADVVVAVYDGSTSGGTAYTVNYALKKNKRVIIINPTEVSL